MAKFSRAERFSIAYGVPRNRFRDAGLFDPILTKDTPLFVDPLLLSACADRIREAAVASFSGFFTNIYNLLRASRIQGDVAWEEARRRIQFNEVPGACLGYGAGIHGSGWGEKLTNLLLVRAKQIIDLGVDDPDLFLLIGLFQEDIGPDRISDMTIRVVLEDFAAVTTSFCNDNGVPIQPFRFGTRDFALPLNPFERKRSPVILIPRDILRELPIAQSYDDIWEVAAENAALRARLNTQVGDIWEVKSRKAKEAALRVLLNSADAFNVFLNEIKAAAGTGYDLERDPKGHETWVSLLTISADHPAAIARPRAHTLPELRRVVEAVIEQFRHLIEDRDLWRVLHESPSRKTEKFAQLIFFAVALSYCRANQLDVTPEADTGSGPVDFKFSAGDRPKILVEIKLSRGNVVHGYEVQLPAYVAGEQADDAFFVVIDIGGMGEKLDRAKEVRRRLLEEGLPAHDIKEVDGNARPSASRR